MQTKTKIIFIFSFKIYSNVIIKINGFKNVSTNQNNIEYLTQNLNLNKIYKNDVAKQLGICLIQECTNQININDIN